jgi:hypothetical protein
MKPSIIRSVVVRHMKRLSGFTQWKDGAEIPPGLPFPGGEEVIGWYRNPAPFDSVVVLFTVAAIRVLDGERLATIPLLDIVGYDLPESKQTADGVRVLTSTGDRFIRFAGSHGPDHKFRDAFALVSILHVFVRGRRPTE